MQQTTDVPLQHIGIIMDGNGRWGVTKRGSRTHGHRAGAKNVETIIAHAVARGVKTLTLYAFSTENWARAGWEIRVLMYLLRDYSERKVVAMVKENISVRFIGRRDRLDAKLLAAMLQMETETAECSGMRLMIAIDYGGRDEIVRAAEQLAYSGEIFTEGALARYLDTKHAPNVDLIIRTGGNQRLSNFLLWQSAYAEIHCTDTLWPDFTPEEFDVIIDLFLGTERRFGAVPTAAE